MACPLDTVPEFVLPDKSPATDPVDDAKEALAGLADAHLAMIQPDIYHLNGDIPGIENNDDVIFNLRHLIPECNIHTIVGLCIVILFIATIVAVWIDGAPLTNLLFVTMICGLVAGIFARLD